MRSKLLKLSKFVKITAIILFLSIAFDSQPTTSKIVAQTQPLKLEEVHQLYNRGVAKFKTHDIDSAIAYFQEALEHYQKLQHSQGRINTLIMLGAAYNRLAQYQMAVNTLETVLPLILNTNNLPRQLQALGYLGVAHHKLGQYLKALETTKEALDIAETLENPGQKARLLISLGNTYEALGDYDKAKELYNESLEIANKVNDNYVRKRALGNLGFIETNLDNYDKALTYYEEGLAIAEEENDLYYKADILIHIGIVYHEEKNYEKAEQHYSESLEIAQTKNIGNIDLIKSRALASLGMVADHKKNYDEAIQYYQQALEIAKQIDEPLFEAEFLNNLAHTFLTVGNLQVAEEKLRDSIEILERIRGQLANADNYRISMFDTRLYTYNLLQQVLIAQNKTEKALEDSENGRNRAFVNLQFQRLSVDNNTENSLSETIKIENIKQIAKQQNATLVEYTIIPRDDMIHDGKRRGTSGKLYIWVVKPTGEIFFKQVDLTEKNIALKTLIPEMREGDIGVRGRGNSEASNQNNKSLEQGELTENLHELHTILIEPIKEFLPKDENEPVIIIPDEILFQLPFAALQDAEGKYLIDKHTLITAPSIQSLFFTQQNAQRIQTENKSKEILMVGNPTMPQDPLGPEQQSLSPLFGAETEVDQLAKMFQTFNLFDKIEPLKGDSATETRVIEKMPNAQIIHFATHGLLDEIHGIGSPGVLAFATDEDNDGWLTTDEIMKQYGLLGTTPLKAELVVLSACDTGRGDITGDGVIGLSRSILAAGVPTVLVSLWKVGDDETVDIMTNFYSNLYEHKMSKAQALRRALLTAKDQDPEEIRIWGAFTLIGEGH
ncbi:MAG: CHAT domain-containing protein [Crocosphaera sp.]|nr:CHAT domain-containing protein [Crocosphaera sp.]